MYYISSVVVQIFVYLCYRFHKTIYYLLYIQVNISTYILKCFIGFISLLVFYYQEWYSYINWHYSTETPCPTFSGRKLSSHFYPGLLQNYLLMHNCKGNSCLPVCMICRSAMIKALKPNTNFIFKNYEFCFDFKNSELLLTFFWSFRM